MREVAAISPAYAILLLGEEIRILQLNCLFSLMTLVKCTQQPNVLNNKMYLTTTSNMTDVTLLSRAVAQFVIAIGKSELIIQLIRLE